MWQWQRRSALESSGDRRARILLVDTVGELSAWWGTAQIAYVGGSMGSRGGQNMIEPAAYASAVSFGPRTENFYEVVQRSAGMPGGGLWCATVPSCRSSCGAVLMSRIGLRSWAVEPSNWSTSSKAPWTGPIDLLSELVRRRSDGVWPTRGWPTKHPSRQQRPPRCLTLPLDDGCSSVAAFPFPPPGRRWPEGAGGRTKGELHRRVPSPRPFPRRGEGEIIGTGKSDGR